MDSGNSGMPVALIEPLGEFVCTVGECNNVLLLDRMEAHMKRRHGFSAQRVQQLFRTISKIDRTTGRVSYWKRYFDEPYPEKDDTALPELPILRVYDVIKCPLCQHHAGSINSCKGHMNASHPRDPNIVRLRAALSTAHFVKAQTLYTGPKEKKLFPVTCSGRIEPSLEPSLPPILTGRNVDAAAEQEKEKITRKDWTMSTAAAILNLSGFLDKRNLTFDASYKLTTFQRPQTYSGVMRLLKSYVNDFCDRKEEVQQHLIDMVRLKNIECESNFSLNIQPDSRERYIKNICRIVAGVSNLTKWNGDTSATSIALETAAKEVLNCATSTPHSFEQLSVVHKLFRSLFLCEVEASKGDRVVLEDVFKLVLSGFSSSGTSGTTRVGYSDDASHLCAALQFICQLVALAEFMVPPAGFGPQSIRGSTSETDRRERLQELISTTAGTPAAFIRVTLKKTKRLSRGDRPRISFAPCFEHKYCGKVDNIEVMMNSNERGSIGYAIRSIQQDASRLLQDKILLRFPIPSSTWRTVLSFADNISCKDAGYFFGSHRDSKPIMDKMAETFAFYLTKGTSPVIELFNNDGVVEWKHSKNASSWLRCCDKFMQLLYVLIHLCGGGPPRVTEMICSKFKNTANGRRNIVLYKGYLAILVSYTKTQSQFEKAKPIARFLDRITTTLLLSFIVFVKPVQSFLMEKSVGRVCVTDEFLFVRHGDILSESTIYSFFKTVMHSKGVPLTVLLYRHFRTGIVKTYLGTHAELTGDNVAIYQSGHSENTALSCYAGVDFDFSEFTTAVTEAYLTVSLKWHEMAGIGGRRFETPGKELVSSQKGMEPRALPDVTGKKKRSAPKEPSSFVRISPPLKKSKACHSTAQEDAERALQLLIGKHSAVVEFKSEEQRRATIESQMQSNMMSRSCSIVVLPTGGGKTVCWAAPALAEQLHSLQHSSDMRVTVVLIPLISLLEEQLQRCVSDGLNAVGWNERHRPAVTVILASIDVAKTEEYRRFVSVMASRKLLARIVVDEVHLLKLWEHFRHFGSLAGSVRPPGTDVPLLLLSATIPRTLVSGVLDKVGADDSCFKIIRQNVGRPNISYDVVDMNEERTSLLSRAVEYVEEKRASLQEKERVIVYCISVNDAIALHEQLSKKMGSSNVHLYHGGMGRGERYENYSAWVGGETVQVMVATAAFSCGIDYFSVRIVIHVGGSRTLVEFAQETGRAGRDGRGSKSIVLYNRAYLREKTICPREEGFKKKACQITKRVIAGPRCCHDEIFGSFYSFAECKTGCRRAILEDFLNGSNRGPCTKTEAPCDLCGGADKNKQQAVDDILRSATSDNVPRMGEKVAKARSESPKATASSCSAQRAAKLSVTPILVAFRMTEENISTLVWMAKELSMADCAVCVIRMKRVRGGKEHKQCVRGRCFRCMEKNAIHQSRDCNVVPRTKVGEDRCYFCGIPRAKRCHDAKDYNRRSCPWLIVKNMTLILWHTADEQELLFQAIPHLIPCNTVTEACAVLCGCVGDSEVTAMFAAVQYLHRRFIAERATPLVN